MPTFPIMHMKLGATSGKTDTPSSENDVNLASFFKKRLRDIASEKNINNATVLSTMYCRPVRVNRVNMRCNAIVGYSFNITICKMVRCCHSQHATTIWANVIGYLKRNVILMSTYIIFVLLLDIITN